MAPGIDFNDRSAWDDSALIDSWDEALAEYNKYHSIRKQGKRLEDVLSDEELRQLREDHGDLIEEVEARCRHDKGNSIHADAEHAERSQGPANGNAPVGPNVAQAEEPTRSGHQERAGATPTPGLTHDGALAASMPQAILGSVQDEKLKNLMMSWYYAGYYTAMCEGQQQAAASSDGTAPGGQE